MFLSDLLIAGTRIARVIGDITPVMQSRRIQTQIQIQIAAWRNLISSGVSDVWMQWQPPPTTSWGHEDVDDGLTQDGVDTDAQIQKRSTIQRGGRLIHAPESSTGNSTRYLHSMARKHLGQAEPSVQRGIASSRMHGRWGLRMNRNPMSLHDGRQRAARCPVLGRSTGSPRRRVCRMPALLATS